MRNYQKIKTRGDRRDDIYEKIKELDKIVQDDRLFIRNVEFLLVKENIPYNKVESTVRLPKDKLLSILKAHRTKRKRGREISWWRTLVWWAKPTKDDEYEVTRIELSW